MKSSVVWLSDWLDDRTGYKKVLHELLYENVPGGSSWIYVTGSMLVFAFVTQAVTGIFLWMAYSPGSQNAWESVYWIQNEMQGGWLLRGVHHFMAQAMVVLLPLHLLQVVLCRAYTKPREINFWLGLVLMQLVLALGLTGYLLPWDQKGYWATKVATELMSLPPGGAYIQKLVVGGSEYGHATLTRFFAMHAGVLPALLVMVLGLHVAMFRRHGVTPKTFLVGPDEDFWPKQVFKDAFACLILLAVVLGIVVIRQGAELGPPAEPTESYGAARPEWYFLFLFQLLKKFHNEFIGAIVVPGLVMGFLFMLPLIAKVKHGHVVNVVVILILMIGAGYLTHEAIDHDQYSVRYADRPVPESEDAADLHRERLEASAKFLEAKEQAHHEYERIQELIEFYGIPKEGAGVSLVRNDPEIQGPRIFRRNCASCHSYLDGEGEGIAGPEPPKDENNQPTADPDPFGAPNLYGFASREWIRGMLDPERIAAPHYFGQTKHKNGMMAADFVELELVDLDDEQKQTLEKIVVALSAEADLVSQAPADAKAAKDGTIAEGAAALEVAVQDQACTDCHKFHDAGDLGTAPDLTDYGSATWLRDFISNPEHARFYPDNNDRMPVFAQHPGQPERNLLTAHEIDMLVRWIRGDDRDLAIKLALQRRAQPEEPAEAAVQAEPEEPAADESAGARLFRMHCARCHSYLDESGESFAVKEGEGFNGAPDLYGFASRKWLTGFLDPEGILDNRYFGKTAHAKQDEDGAYREGGMVQYVHDTLTDLGEADQKVLQQVIAAVSAEAALPSQAAEDQAAKDDGTIEAGHDALVNYYGCTDCHKFQDDGELGYAPDLTGYGSLEWLTGMISDPEDERFYVDSNDRMPAFAAHDDPDMNRLTVEEIETLARWIRGE